MKYYVKAGKFGVHERDILIPKEILQWYNVPEMSDIDSLGQCRVKDEYKPRCRLVAVPNINDWRLVKREAMRTLGSDPYKEFQNPTSAWKHSILKARHSPIRLLNYVIEFDNVPYCYAMHLARHVHATPFISSQRPDHQLPDAIDFTELDRLSFNQGALVNMSLLLNADELMTIAEKRLCMKASKFTRLMVKTACDLIQDDDKAWTGLLAPRCSKGDTCLEMYPCGKLKGEPKRYDY